MCLFYLFSVKVGFKLSPTLLCFVGHDVLLSAGMRVNFMRAGPDHQGEVKPR